MRQYLKNASDFSVDCAVTDGQCEVVRANFHFIDGGLEHMAIAHLQLKCGKVVITPDAADGARAWLYLTGCARMGDVVEQIFRGHLQARTRIAAASSEMSVGELHRRALDLGYAECRARVEAFVF